MKTGYKYFLLFLLAGLVVACDTASNMDDPTSNYFLKYYGVDGDQEGVDFVVNTDGSFVLLGNSKKPGENSQIYLVKADDKGMVIWERFFGDSVKQEVNVKDVEVTSSGNLVMVGEARLTPGGNWNIIIMTIDQAGNKLDSGWYSIPGFDQIASSVTETDDGFVVGGYTTKAAGDTDGIHARFFLDCSPYPVVWDFTTGRNGFDDYVTKVIQKSDLTGFFVFGSTRGTPSDNSLNYWWFGIGTTGDINTGDSAIYRAVTDEELKSVTVVPSQPAGAGYLLSGLSTNTTSGISSLFVSKINIDLSVNPIISQITVAALGNFSFSASASKLLSVASGTSNSNGYYFLANLYGNNSNMILYRMDNQGNTTAIWNSPVELGGSGDDFAGAVQELPDGKVAILGTMAIGDDRQSKMTLIKVNSDGLFLP